MVAGVRCHRMADFVKLRLQTFQSLAELRYQQVPDCLFDIKAYRRHCISAHLLGADFDAVNPSADGFAIRIFNCTSNLCQTRFDVHPKYLDQLGYDLEISSYGKIE
jgi:hypothetical protein